MHPVRRPRSIVALAALLFVVLLAPACPGAGTPEQICDAAKAKAAAKRASAKILCNAKAMAKGVGADIKCLDKAGEKFLAAYAKADAKGPCEGRNAAYFEFLTDQFMSNVLIAVQCRNTGSTCFANAQCCSAQCNTIGSVCQ
jgi:hypothetical protein